MPNTISILRQNEKLLGDLRDLILEARQNAARTINSALIMLYWRVYQRIRKDILKEERADYGEQIVATLSRKLVEEFGTGFRQRNLANMIRFAEVYPDPKILHAFRAKLSWTHFRLIICLDDPLKRDFYAEMRRLEGWSTRTLEKKIGSMLFERTALSRKVKENS